MTPKIDKEKCIGCGTCVSIAEDIFKMGEDGKASVIEGCDCTGKEELVNQAKDACPVTAISVE